MTVTRYCIRSYRQDLRIFPSLGHRAGLVLLALFLLSFPAFAGKYYVHVACVCGISIISALGLNLLTGYTGLISLGHAGFMGVGGYTAAILATRAGMPFFVTIPLAGIVSAAFGAVVGIPTLRLKGLYLVVTTLAFQFIAEHVFFHWESMTQADRGILIPPATLFGLSFEAREAYYYVVLAMVVISAMFTKNLAMSRTGRALVAVRDRDVAAEIIGIHVARYKILAFIVSAFMAGIAGGMYGYLAGHIGPDLYTFNQSVLYIGMIIVGGMGTVLGAILGAVFMTLLPVFIGEISGPLASMYPAFASRIGAIDVMVYGLVIIGFLLLEPDGLVGIWIRVKRYWTTWPFTY